MFKNEYQGGAHVEIFSAQGKDPTGKWKLSGSQSAIWKDFDKEVKSFVFVLEGSGQTNKMQLPKENKQTLGLIQRYLVLQLYIPLGQDFSAELLITDLANIKRRLYLSTVHKELSATPLHAKIPLTTVRRKIWCNLCVDLAALTSGIFKEAVFQSLDGIVISANCKLRKIYTMKLRPRDALQDLDTYRPTLSGDDPTDSIPRSVQISADVSQVTQVLDLEKLRQCEAKPEAKLPTAAEADQLSNRGPGSASRSKTQDRTHIAFGSKVAGPPPASSRRTTSRSSAELSRSTRRHDRSLQQLSQEKAPGSENGRKLTHSPDQRNKENVPQRSRKDPSLYGTERRPQPPGEPPADKKIAKGTFSENADSRLTGSGVDEREFRFQDDSAEFSDGVLNEVPERLADRTQDTEDFFPHSPLPRSAPRGKFRYHSAGESSLLAEDFERDGRGAGMDEDFYGSDGSIEECETFQKTSSPKLDCGSSADISLASTHSDPEFTATTETSGAQPEDSTSSSTRSANVNAPDLDTFQKTLMPTRSLSPDGSRSEMSKPIPTTSRNKPALSVNRLKTSMSKKSLREIPPGDGDAAGDTSGYEWTNYQTTQLSASEMQMLASLKRQHNEDLEDEGGSHGLSQSQIDHCNVDMSTSSDDTATWNSCQPPPVNQGCHYENEMNPLNHSNPRDWLNASSPPIVPTRPSQDRALLWSKQPSSHSCNEADDGFGPEEEEEILTLLYDPCLNCYFDPETGKYYELA
ncbi:protein CFAP20DC isoform X2 [Spea bombifrons]|uniref:protein CFAP20DC isoform X2 n=1 Tax=Spea bombifrons TaxID=233779 RepID=UPI002349F106|nr:protein CFAP20DC isoform X2 [Spea bombifrons]